MLAWIIFTDCHNAVAKIIHQEHTYHTVNAHSKMYLKTKSRNYSTTLQYTQTKQSGATDRTLH